MEAERKIQRSKIALMRADVPELRFWSGVMMVGRTEVRDDIPTACTNGRDEFYGRAFIDSLKRDQEVNFVVLHENYHKGKRDLSTYTALHNRNPQLANIAMDHYINLSIVEGDLEERYVAMPRNADGERIGCYDERFKGMTVKQIFDLLEQEQESGGGGSGSGGEGHDEHDWAGAQELTEEERKELEREIDQALRQGEMAARKCGSGGANLPVEITDLLHPQIDWQEALREFVTSLCTNKDASSWRRVNRRYLSNDVYMPTLVGERVGHVVLGADMSGSTWVGNTMKTIFTEMVSLCQTVQPEKLDLLYWDGAVAGHEEYAAGDYDALLQSTKPVGGGGTSPSCVSDYLNENNMKPDCIIMVTDGYVGTDWGSDWPAPVLWVVIGSGITAANGRTIHIKD